MDSKKILILMGNGKFVSKAHSPFHTKLGIRPTDQSCHHEARLHLDDVEWRSERSHRERHDRRILVRERSAPYHYEKQKRHICDVKSDHLLSS